MKRLSVIIIIFILLLGGVSCGKSEPGTPSEAIPPSISSVSASDITETTATITWTTNEPATSQVEYGKTSGYGLKTPLDEKLVTSHSVTLSDLEPNTAYHFRVRSKDTTGNEAVSGDDIFSTAKPDIMANIDIDFSWHLESNYTSVPTYVSNQSGYSADVVIRIKAFNLQNITIYDNSFTLSDISPGETYYKPFNVTGTDTANVEVTLADVYPTQTPPNSNRTDLVILNELPITVEQEETFNVDIRNESNNQLSVRVKVRWYDYEGYLRGASVTSFLGNIEPSETKRFRWEALSMWPSYKYYIYLVD